MENIIIIVLKALGALGEKGVHWFLELIETKVIASSTEIDNEVFFRVLEYVKSYVPKNPTE
jgi:hypothetical protein